MGESAANGQLRDLIREIGKLSSTVLLAPETRFVEDLGIDSLDLVAMFLGVQDRLGVVIEDEDVSSLKTVGELQAYLAQRNASIAA